MRLTKLPHYLCLMCHQHVDRAMPIPQLCAACRQRGWADVLATKARHVAMLKTTWSTMIDHETQARFEAVLEAWSESKLPAPPLRRMNQRKDFERRIVATVTKADRFAALVETWYDAVLSEEEYDAMMVQAQFAVTEVTQ
jgi:hypothetical protein